MDLSLDKEQRVNIGESAMTHAMLFTGVDVVAEQPLLLPPWEQMGALTR